MLLDYVEGAMSFLGQKVAYLTLAVDSDLSVVSLFSALCLAVASILLRRHQAGKRDLKYAVLARALFPRWWCGSASFRADVGYVLFTVFAFGMLLGWAVVSSRSVAEATQDALVGAWGVLPTTALSRPVSGLIVTVSLFIAYEISYWIDHYLSHRIPLLWEFHKVHHTAEVLSPLTNFRVHPVDAIVFGNILGLITGITTGVLNYWQLGGQFGVNDTNALFLAFFLVLGHLQHSHLWIPTTGLLGRIVLSPAHHQLHHSDDPRHFDKNFGSFLAVWDWLFGTLHVPERKREHLSFGVGQPAASHHTVMGAVVTPFVQAVVLLAGQLRAVAQAQGVTAHSTRRR